MVERLTKNVTEDHLREIFGQYGEIHDMDVPLSRQCKLPTYPAAALLSRFASDSDFCHRFSQTARIAALPISFTSTKPMLNRQSHTCTKPSSTVQQLACPSSCLDENSLPHHQRPPEAQIMTHGSRRLDAGHEALVVAQLLMAVAEVVAAAAVDLREGRLRRRIHGALDPPPGPGRLPHLLEAVDTGRGLRPTHGADLEAHHLRGGEGVDDTTMTMTEDAAPAVTATTVTPDAEAVGAVRGIVGATVEEAWDERA